MEGGGFIGGGGGTGRCFNFHFGRAGGTPHLWTPSPRLTPPPPSGQNYSGCGPQKFQIHHTPWGLYLGV